MDKVQTIVGNTPVIKAENLAQYLGIEAIYFKDDTKNPSGSFKDRAISYQINHWVSIGKNEFVISSSGNAAISAAYFVSQIKSANLSVYISEKIESYKLERLERISNNSSNIEIIKSKTARKDAILASKEGKINLTGTKDPNARIGYKTLGEEIKSYFNDKTLDAVFIPSSSGVGLLGMMDGYNDKYPTYAVQTTYINEIAKHFTTDFLSTDSSLATAIQARFVPSKKEIIEKINKSNGSALAISDEMLRSAFEIVKEKENLEISFDSLLSVAGLIYTLKQGKEIKSALCILTGY